MKKQITVHQAVISFLHNCKDNQLPIETLVAYENTLCDFFGGTGTEYIEDIANGSQIEYIGSVSLLEMEDYKDRQILQCVSVEALNDDLRRLRAFFEYCVEQGYMERLENKQLKEDDTKK